MIKNPIDFDAHMRRRLAKETPTRRLQMASRMFATARALVRAGRNEANTDDRTFLFLRFYANDFSETEREKIVSALTR